MLDNPLVQPPEVGAWLHPQFVLEDSGGGSKHGDRASNVASSVQCRHQQDQRWFTNRVLSHRPPQQRNG